MERLRERDGNHALFVPQINEKLPSKKVKVVINKLYIIEPFSVSSE
jgi:hypothetical protein